jgi:hypothetical protein
MDFILPSKRGQILRNWRTFLPIKPAIVSLLCSLHPFSFQSNALSASKTHFAIAQARIEYPSFGHFVKRANNDRIQYVAAPSPPLAELSAGRYGSASRLISRVIFAGFGFDHATPHSRRSAQSMSSRCEPPNRTVQELTNSSMLVRLVICRADR